MASLRALVLGASLLCFGCVDSGSMPPLPTPPRPVTTEAQVVGCYQRVEDSARRGAPRYDAPWVPPRTFHLTSTVLTVSPVDGFPGTVAIRNVMQAPRHHLRGMWVLAGTDTVYVAWSTGLRGVGVTLRRGSTDDVWRGRTAPFSDDGIVGAAFDIAARRVAPSRCNFVTDAGYSMRL